MGILKKIMNIEITPSKTPAKPAYKPQAKKHDDDIVFVNSGSKVFHYDQMCAMSNSVNCVEMKEKQALKKGLKPCKKCSGYR